ncbi:dTDP-4-dehydrorhamnose reductase [Raoultella ornithinolytica]|uniref:dTDP-4-dehydrorhamnose reductase n=1 Tax=Raoultella TaxID=160674 RepID=UPI0039B4D20E
MRILLTGANGQLGNCFRDRIPENWYMLATDSSTLDITDKEKVLAVINSYKPDVIVNAAAYTAVDKAETEVEKAEKINALGPENLALAAKICGAKLVHVSTDYVFDGKASSPYTETDMTNPLGIYGKTKLKGELAVTNMLPSAIILRTAWVYSEYGNNFVKTMIRLGKERNNIGVVSDQFGCPTYAGDIAQVIIEMLKINARGGIYHFCGDKKVSWHEFAEDIFSEAMLQGKIKKVPRVDAITTEQYPTPAKRPQYSVMDTRKLQSTIGNISITEMKEVISKL